MSARSGEVPLRVIRSRADLLRSCVVLRLDLIGESGAAGVTMRGVCRRAGLTTRYFYENFATRDELLDLLYR
ncbi:TetR family transcriptional regulator [Nocardia beijingensis]|uniref:TetR family transcriptional regulator n=1 Tax=Nocardia beijingensis TaxID=95162 RepID=UPI003D9F7987